MQKWRPSDRSLLFFDEEGLQTLTGLNPETGVCEILSKECIDNALDKTKVNFVKVSLRSQKDYALLIISDDGKETFPEDQREIESKLLNFSKSISSKRRRKVVSRGKLGNGLQCCIGLVSTAWKGKSPPLDYNLSIASGNKIYFVKARKERDEIISSVKSKDSEETKLTTITFVLPPYLGSDKNQVSRITDIVEHTSWVNPQVMLEFELDGETIIPSSNVADIFQRLSEREDMEVPDPISKWKEEDRAGNIFCFSREDFSDFFLECSRVTGLEEETGLSFVKKFANFRTGASEVLNEAGIGQQEFLREIEDGRIIALYESMREKSRRPSERELPLLEKEHFKRLLKERFTGHHQARGLYENRHSGVLIPWALEIVAFNDESPSIYEFVNFSYMGLKHPLTEGVFPTGRKGMPWLDVGEMVSQKGMSLIIHAVSPNFGYQDPSKGSIDTSIFGSKLRKAIESAGRKIRSSRGQIGVLRQIIRERLGEVKRDPAAKVRNKWTQSTVYYIARKRSPKIKRKSFTKDIRKVCTEFGFRRDQLGIVAADRAQMYFRGKWSDVGLDELQELATKGTDILFIEKEGVAEILAPLDKEGIAILNSRGFCVEYADDLMKLATKKGCNLAVITDLDASGVLISIKIPNVPRIAVTLETVKELGLDISNVEEKYDPFKNHLKSLEENVLVDPKLLNYVKEKRIEIDSILALIEPERFWSCILKELGRAHPIRDYTRSLEVDASGICQNRYLSMIKPLLELAKNRVEKVTQDQLSSMKCVSGFADAQNLEEKFESDVAGHLDQDTVLAPIEMKLKAVISNELRKSPK